MARTLVVLLVLFVTGAPIARSLTRDRLEWTQFVFESCVIGLVAQIAIAIALMRAGHFTQLGLVVVTALVIAAGLAAGGWRLFPRPPTVDARWLVATVVLLAIALALRAHPSYFLFNTGDMGEYVNVANITARGATLVESFPHGFTMYLAATNLLLGRAHTVGGLPALGLLIVLGIISFARALGVRAVAALGAGAIMVVHPIAVWFSTFPVSETLYAALLVGALYFLMQARTRRAHAYGVMSGLTFGMLLFVRGNAMLLAPILAAALLLSAAFDDDPTYRVQRTATVTALLALAAGYAYDVRYVFKYFVGKQLHEFLPGIAYRAAHHLHLLQSSWWLLVATVLGLGALLVLTVAVRRVVAPFVDASDRWIFRVLSAAAVLGALAAALVIGISGLDDALVRWGPAVLVLAAVGIVLVVVRPGRYFDTTTGLVVLVVILTYTVLFASRIPKPLAAPYYLYWDRYLFSEVFPLVMLLVAIAFDALVDLCVRAPAPATRVRVVGAVALGAVLVAMVPSVIETRRVTRYTLFGAAYGALARVDRLTRPAPGRGVKPTIVYSGFHTLPPYWFPQESYSEFALPLESTFARSVIGALGDPHHADAQFDPATALAALARKHLRGGYLVDARDPGAMPFPDDAHTRFVGEVDYRMPVIARSLDRSQERWHVISVTLDVYALTS